MISFILVSLQAIQFWKTKWKIEGSWRFCILKSHYDLVIINISHMDLEALFKSWLAVQWMRVLQYGEDNLNLQSEVFGISEN